MAHAAEQHWQETLSQSPRRPPLCATPLAAFGQIEGAVVIEFDIAKNQMTVKRRCKERVFTKEK